MFLPLQGIAPESSWLEGVPLKDYKIIWKTNVTEMKTKLYLETLILPWIKLTEMVEIKQKLYRCRSKVPGYTGSTLI